MTYQIDQSGKIEDTARNTVIAYSNDTKCTVLLRASDKRLLQEIFRNLFNKERIFVYRVFSALLFILLAKIKPQSVITIDREYPGKESLIIRYCKEMCRQNNTSEFLFSFNHIGKSSSAHTLAYQTFKGVLKPNKRVTLHEIIELLFPKHKKGPGIPLLAGPRALKRRMVTAGRKPSRSK